MSEVKIVFGKKVKDKNVVSGADVEHDMKLIKEKMTEKELDENDDEETRKRRPSW